MVRRARSLAKMMAVMIRPWRAGTLPVGVTWLHKGLHRSRAIDGGACRPLDHRLAMLLLAAAFASAPSYRPMPPGGQALPNGASTSSSACRSTWSDPPTSWRSTCSRRRPSGPRPCARMAWPPCAMSARAGGRTGALMPKSAGRRTRPKPLRLAGQALARHPPPRLAASPRAAARSLSRPWLRRYVAGRPRRLHQGVRVPAHARGPARVQPVAGRCSASASPRGGPRRQPRPSQRACRPVRLRSPATAWWLATVPRRLPSRGRASRSIWSPTPTSCASRYSLGTTSEPGPVTFISFISSARSASTRWSPCLSPATIARAGDKARSAAAISATAGWTDGRFAGACEPGAGVPGNYRGSAHAGVGRTARP